MKRLTVILFLFLLAPASIASAELTKGEIKEIQGIMRQELQHVDKRFDDMNKRFDDINKRIDDMNNRIDDINNLMLWGFGIIFAGMFVLVGFIIWDRRTALAPAIRKNKELEERQERIEKALKEFAIKEPRLAEILKQIGL